MPQGSILRPLFFLIYINDLSVDIISTVKLFADGTSLFVVVHDPTTSANGLNKDLQKICEWVYLWKISFNPDSVGSGSYYFQENNKIISRLNQF